MSYKYVRKPWGGYEEHYRAPDLSVCYKTLYVDPGHQLSLQYHEKRSEIWWVSDEHSLFEMTLGDNKTILNGKHRIDIPTLTNHTVKNMSSRILIIHETQYGYCDESDIVRLYDPYKRS